MNIWITYERMRAAVEEAFRGRLRRALGRQVEAFAAHYRRTGQPDVSVIKSAELLPALSLLYVRTGTRFARQTIRDLRPQIGRVKSGPGGYAVKAARSFEEDVVRSLQLSGLNLAQKMTDTTRKQVLAILEESIRKGWGVEKTAAAIVAVSKDVNRKRARLITRTEITRAANVGKILGAKTFEVEMEKEWVAAADERTRVAHWARHGEKVHLDARFPGTAEYPEGMIAPGDPSAPGSETINCRCTLVFNVIKDAEGNAIPRRYYTPDSGTLLPASRPSVSRWSQFAQALTTGLTLGTILRELTNDPESI